MSNFYPSSLPHLRFISNPEMAQRKTGNVRLASDGKMMRDASSPGGTLVGTQTYGDTPEKNTRHGCSTSKRTPARQRGTANSTRRPSRTLARRQNAKKKQESEPANLPLYAHWLRAFPSSRLLAWDRSEPSCKRHSPRKCAEQSRLLRNEMLETPGRRLISR